MPSTGLFPVLTVLITIGMAGAIIGFRHGSRNEFEIEADIVEKGRYATRTCTDDPEPPGRFSTSPAPGHGPARVP